MILASPASFWAIVAVFAAVAGLIPGPAQTLAVKAALDAIFSWLGMAVYVAVVGAVGALSAALFNATSNSMVAMPLVTMLLIAVFFALRRVRAWPGVGARQRRPQDRCVGQRRQPHRQPPAPVDSTPGQLDRLDPLTRYPHSPARRATMPAAPATKAISTAGKLGRPDRRPRSCGARRGRVGRRARRRQNRRPENAFRDNTIGPTDYPVPIRAARPGRATESPGQRRPPSNAYSVPPAPRARRRQLPHRRPRQRTGPRPPRPLHPPLLPRRRPREPPGRPATEPPPRQHPTPPPPHPRQHRQPRASRVGPSPGTPHLLRDPTTRLAPPRCTPPFLRRVPPTPDPAGPGSGQAPQLIDGRLQ